MRGPGLRSSDLAKPICRAMNWLCIIAVLRHHPLPSTRRVARKPRSVARYAPAKLEMLDTFPDQLLSPDSSFD